MTTDLLKFFAGIDTADFAVTTRSMLHDVFMIPSHEITPTQFLHHLETTHIQIFGKPLHAACCTKNSVVAIIEIRGGYFPIFFRVNDCCDFHDKSSVDIKNAFIAAINDPEFDFKRRIFRKPIWQQRIILKLDLHYSVFSPDVIHEYVDRCIVTVHKNKLIVVSKFYHTEQFFFTINLR